MSKIENFRIEKAFDLEGDLPSILYDDTLYSCNICTQKESTNKWISIQDQLPEIDEKVLTCNNKYPETTDFVNIGYYDPETGTTSGWRCEEHCNLNVTHWMCLPFPPKNKNQSSS